MSELFLKLLIHFPRTVKFVTATETMKNVPISTWSLLCWGKIYWDDRWKISIQKRLISFSNRNFMIISLLVFFLYILLYFFIFTRHGN